MKIEKYSRKRNAGLYPNSEEHGGEGVMKNDMKKRILSAQACINFIADALVRNLL